MSNSPPQLTRLVAILALALLSGCGRSGAPEPGATDRVVSLSPALTRIALALGSRDRLVGVDQLSQQVEGARDLPVLGGLFAPDLERTVELAPTLVIAIASAEQADFFSQLETRGITVETFSGHSLSDVLASYQRLGALLDARARGAQLAAEVRDGLAALRASAPAQRPSLVVVLESDPLYVVGGGSFVNDLIEAAGARNAFGELDDPYPRVSLEVLAERAPDVLIDTTLPAGDEAGAHVVRARWERFSWVERVEALPQGVVTLPGPELVEAAQLLRDRVHGTAVGSR